LVIHHYRLTRLTRRLLNRFITPWSPASFNWSVYYYY